MTITIVGFREYKIKKISAACNICFLKTIDLVEVQK